MHGYDLERFAYTSQSSKIGLQTLASTRKAIRNQSTNLLKSGGDLLRLIEAIEDLAYCLSNPKNSQNEDLNHHDSLRDDPAHGLMAGKADIEGLTRSEGNQGKPLAGHSTLNRLEQSALGGDGRYKKTIPDAAKIEQLLIEEGVKAIPRKSRRIVLDFDATDDPLHGAQEGRFFHGYYGHYCYLPLYCFCGNIPLLALLQDAKTDALAVAGHRSAGNALGEGHHRHPPPALVQDCRSGQNQCPAYPL